jgi:hypothetical protein
MNLFNIIQEIEKVDPEFHERISPRRDAIKNITSFGSKVAVAALPFAFSTIFKKAYGQSTPTSVTAVLNFALTLEYLESYFYNQGKAANVTPAVYQPYLNIITLDENNHVKFLQTTLGSAAISSPAFDLTAGGLFPNVLTDFPTFAAVAQTFEDTGVRAYKGQAANLLGNQVVLTAALGIHAVEARHASALRQIRASLGATFSATGALLTPWITGTTTIYNDNGIAAVNANYGPGSPAASFPAENNTIQGGVDVTTLASAYGAATPFNVAVEAFDEPLDMATVVTAVTPFFAK